MDAEESARRTRTRRGSREHRRPEERRGPAEIVALLLLLIATGAGYLWNLGSRGVGNAFYAAAVQAGTKNWTAFFFGSLDSANLITVDKPPASLWPMELSGRIFGFGTWSMLVPQVLMAVAAVATLYATVRRVSGHTAGMLAGALLALTPVVFSMFRYNDPDAMLMLLLTIAAYCTVRGVQSARTVWVVLAGLVVGFAFLTKEFQAFLAVPGLGLAYLWAAPTPLLRRVLQLLAAGAGILVGAGWWVLAVALTPASRRPFIAGSTDNSEVGRALGYNGLARILGGGPHATPESMGIVGDPPGITRLFDARVAGYISWLIPAAVLLLGAGLWLTRRAPRTDLTRAALLLFGGWLAAGGVVLSLMQGIFHEYYTLVLAPPIVGLVAIGGRLAWDLRQAWTGRLLLAATAAVSMLWTWRVLDRTPTVATSASTVVLVAGLLLSVAPLLSRGRRTWSAGLVTTALLLVVAGPIAVATLSVAARPIFVASSTKASAVPPNRSLLVGAAPAPGHHSGHTESPFAGRPEKAVNRYDNRAIAALLEKAGTRWSAATTGSSAAATFELASNTAVMAIGGYAGTDPTPTLAQFEAYVRTGQVGYFVEGGPTAGPGSIGAVISAWVAHHFHHTRVDGRAVFQLLPAPNPVA